MNTVICSHGFGVRADSRGMFTEIADAFPEHLFKMFDYNNVMPSGDVTIPALEDQAKTLQSQVDNAVGEITLLCHSQGCMIAGLIDLSKIHRVILMAPPVRMSMQTVIEAMKKRTGSVYNPNGTSVLPRSDGTTTYLPSEYLKSLSGYDPINLYQAIADTKPTTIIRCRNDEVVGLTNVDTIKNAVHIDLIADHNFTGPARKLLINTLHQVY